VQELEGIHFVITDEPGTPFSFFRWMFWDKQIPVTSGKGEQVFRHEIFHIEQRHSFDIMFIETLSAIFWINPFFHMMKKELRAIHEFLADKFATNEQSKWEYAEFLLMQLMNTKNSLVNPFFNNQIKRRIAMMTSNSTTGQQYFRKLMILPLLVVVSGLFAFTYHEKAKGQHKEVTNKQPQTLLLKEIPTDTPLVNGVRFRASKITLEPGAKGGQTKEPGLIIMNNRKYTQESFRAAVGAGIVEADEIVVTPANDKEAISKYGELAENGVIELRNAKAMKAATTDPLYVVDGKLYPTADQLKGLDPNSIKTVNVLKGASATTKYPLVGENGVIEILTKTGVDLQLTEVPVTGIKVPLKTLDPIVVDGQQLAPTKLDAIDPKALKEIVVNGYKAEATRTGVKTPGEIKEVRVEGKQMMKVQGVEVNKEPLKIEEVVVQGHPSMNASQKLFTETEKAPMFPGGTEKWQQYLQKSLKSIVPIDNGAPAGKYTVIIQFIVMKDGSIRDFKPLTTFGYGMEEEVIRILKAGPGWVPAEQNGHKVSAYTTQKVTFAIEEQVSK
jgi:hypothetical protein